MGKGNEAFFAPEKEFEGSNPDEAMLRRLCGGGMGKGELPLLSTDELIHKGWKLAKDASWSTEIWERFFRIWASKRNTEREQAKQKSAFDAEIDAKQKELDKLNAELNKANAKKK